ncbi:uncharacterized protein Z520_11805 [Fonsecaea multimorphosa CBS 102226]|uniref:C2H2-type domain-containing protein n=1 Tax=Fonsecaea multimorphosa CBS 102226 TaxID=1442371 RepID=A0A0D2GSP9_9EURO|nr:uncharacterized protein Z520_11805 [Fonsecaea multimorphosa CBS 102226]KIX92485.1 hypothetical protein Z520_11805 [Fonsecaea multimorphosa CBS 102226]
MNCYFCDQALPTKDKLKTHISQHLERIAFTVLAKPYQKWHFYDDLASEGSSAPPMELSAEIAHLICNDSVTTVKQLLKDRILTKTLCGNTALWLASQHGKEVIVWLLIQHEFDVNEKDPLSNGKTALHFAAEAGHTSVVELLLNAGSDPVAKLDDGTMAMYLAAQYGHISTIRILWEHQKERLRDGIKNDLHQAWIFAAEHGHSACLGALKSIFEECYSRNLLSKWDLRYSLPEWICDGVEAALEKNMQSTIEEITSYAWNPPRLLDYLRSETSSRTVRWVWLSLGKSALSHFILSNPWLERDWLPTDPSFPDGLTDEAFRDISNTLLITAQDPPGLPSRYRKKLVIPDVDHLQTLLKQHPEFIQLIYLDLAREGDWYAMVALLVKNLTPHPKTLTTLVENKEQGVADLIKYFSSHFSEIDRLTALLSAVRKRDFNIIKLFIKAGSLPTLPSAEADKLLLACAKTGFRRLLKELLNQGTPLFSAAGIAAAKSAANGYPEWAELLDHFQPLRVAT